MIVREVDDPDSGGGIERATVVVNSGNHTVQLQWNVQDSAPLNDGPQWCLNYGFLGLRQVHGTLRGRGNCVARHDGSRVCRSDSEGTSREACVIELVVREFTVDVSVDRAWDHLARVEQWTSWAKHIKRVTLEPSGPLTESSAGAFRLAGGARSSFGWRSTSHRGGGSGRAASSQSKFTTTISSSPWIPSTHG